MRTINLSIRVQTDSDMADADVARVVEQLLDQGLVLAGDEVAASHVIPGDLDIADAKLATELSISSVEVVAKPRVLITVSGGVADHVCDDGVDVETFDWDNFNYDPEVTDRAPAHFRDLAEPLGIPVDGPEEISTSPKMGM